MKKLSLLQFVFASKLNTFKFNEAQNKEAMEPFQMNFIAKEDL